MKNTHELIELAQTMRDLLESPQFKEFEHEAKKVIDRRINDLLRPLSQSSEEDARFGQIHRAEVRGMKSILSIPRTIINQAEIQLKKLQKEREEN